MIGVLTNPVLLCVPTPKRFEQGVVRPKSKCSYPTDEAVRPDLTVLSPEEMLCEFPLFSAVLPTDARGQLLNSEARMGNVFR